MMKPITKKILILPVLLLAAVLLFAGCSGAGKIEKAFVLSDTELTLKVGQTKELTLNNPKNTDVGDYTVEWMSADGKIATVSDEGLITAVAQGEVKITAVVRTDKAEVYFDCALTVKINTDPLTSMEFNASVYTLGEGQTLNLYEEITYSPAHAANNNLLWTSSNTGIATVANGVVSPVSEGISTITAKTQDGKVQATCTVRVSEITVDPTGVSFEEEEYTVVTGKSFELKPIVEPENATGYTILWISSDESVVKVTGGKVTGVSAGQATVTARLNIGGGKYTAECTVTVEDAGSVIVPATKVTLSPSSMTIPENQNGPFNFGLSISPANCTETPVWTCSKSDYLDIDKATGKFTVKKADPSSTVSVVVTCTVGEMSATAVVNISPRKPVIEIATGESGDVYDKAPLNVIELVAAYTDDDLPLPEVIWTSHNPEIATVDKNTGVVTALKAGDCVITAVSKTDPSSGATYTLTVKPSDFVSIKKGESIPLDPSLFPAAVTAWNCPPGYLTINLQARALTCTKDVDAVTKLEIAGYLPNGQLVRVPVYVLPAE